MVQRPIRCNIRCGVGTRIRRRRRLRKPLDGNATCSIQKFDRHNAMLTPDPQQRRAIEHRELSQTIAKTETQIAALRRFVALPPETVAAVKDESSAVGRL